VAISTEIRGSVTEAPASLADLLIEEVRQDQRVKSH
jgi:hypothetical protein